MLRPVVKVLLIHFALEVLDRLLDCLSEAVREANIHLRRWLNEVPKNAKAEEVE